VDFHHSLGRHPHKLLGLARHDVILDSMRGVRMQHVPERAVEDAIGTDARRSSRTLDDGSDSATSVSSSLGELVFHPVHGHVLVLLVVPLGGILNTFTTGRGID
jgi:hypothetical protein